MSGRFDYVQSTGYDMQKRQLELLSCFEELENHIAELGHSRPASLAMTKLEECYMWVGKALRDKQEADAGEATEA